MTGNKTKPTEVTVEDFLARAPTPQRADEARRLIAVMERLSGEPARMWGPSIIGCGVHRYKYASGREGEICEIGFSPRKPALVLYVGVSGAEDLLPGLGKHTTGKGCLYLKKLDDADPAVLEAIIQRRLDRARSGEAAAEG